jgi:hypothetical protein
MHGSKQELKVPHVYTNVLMRREEVTVYIQSLRKVGVAGIRSVGKGCNEAHNKHESSLIQQRTLLYLMPHMSIRVSGTSQPSLTALAEHINTFSMQ